MKNWYIINNYHFGGYAKITKELIDFIMDFNFNQKNTFRCYLH